MTKICMHFYNVKQAEPVSLIPRNPGFVPDDYPSRKRAFFGWYNVYETHLITRFSTR